MGVVIDICILQGKLVDKDLVPDLVEVPKMEASWEWPEESAEPLPQMWLPRMDPLDRPSGLLEDRD